VVAGGATLVRADQAASGQDLESADDYMQRDSFEPSNPEDPYDTRLLLN